MRLVFFGSGAFGVPTLAQLALKHEIALVVTQPDRPAGRGGRTTPTPVGTWAAENLPSVPILKPEKVNLPETIAQIRGQNANAWVVIAFGQKLSQALLKDIFAINLHASLLPRWRGAAPINAAILGGDTITGNSVITLADRMDAGLILGTSARVIEPQMTAGELHDLLAADGPVLVLRVLDQFASNSLDPITQDESQVTIATKLSKNDDDIDFHQPAAFLRREIHALTPWPGISAMLQSPDPAVAATKPATPLKLLRVEVAESATPSNAAEPGTIIDPKHGLVSCGHGSVLRLLEVQPPGKRPMSWAAFANGHAIPPHARLVSARDSA